MTPQKAAMAKARLIANNRELRWCALVAAIRPDWPYRHRGVRLLGPAPAPLSRIKNMTRWQILLKGPTYEALSGPIQAVEDRLPALAGSIKVAIDVDPGALL